MHACAPRRGTWVALAVLVLIGSGPGRGGAAADCEIPAFLVTGKTYYFSITLARLSVKVVEIDRRACWVKGEWKYRPAGSDKDLSGTGWFNVRTVLMIEEVEPAPAPAPPGPRR
jgi:hypothetical protein